MTSRQKILTYLKKTRSASAREIARALKLSAPNVRHHLSILCSDGRVEPTSVRGGAKRGRPEKLYSLSQAALGDNLPALTLALLEEKTNAKSYRRAHGCIAGLGRDSRHRRDGETTRRPCGKN
ncbi:MAG: ArsR family transcriptional regulator [Chloroflexi bacterium]|nr:ArsR family transcriptional regulator [Chloroflexota bacterium]